MSVNLSYYSLATHAQLGQHLMIYRAGLLIPALILDCGLQKNRCPLPEMMNFLDVFSNVITPNYYHYDLERVEGFKPSTNRLEGGDSISELYSHNLINIHDIY